MKHTTAAALRDRAVGAHALELGMRRAVGNMRLVERQVKHTVREIVLVLQRSLEDLSLIHI